ncbi:MAG: cupin domain-containing protein [bacterium]
MEVYRLSEVEGYWTPPPNRRFLGAILSPKLQSIKRVAVGMVAIPPGAEGGLHSHDGVDEVWYIVSGSGRVQVGDEMAEIGPETVIYGPPGLPHQLINTGNEVLKAIWVISPPGDEIPILEGTGKAPARL